MNMAAKGSKINFIYNMIYQVILMIIPLITMPYVSRVLGADNIGIYSYTYTIAQYFLMLGMLGISDYGNREIAKVRENADLRNRVFSQIYTLQIILSVLSIIFYLVFIAFFNQYRWIALLQAFYVLSSLFDVNWLYFGMEDFKLTVTRKIAVKIINLILIFMFVKDENSLAVYTLVLSLGFFIAQSSMILFIKRYVNFHFSHIKEAFSHFKGIFILFIPAMAASIYRSMDKVMLGAMSTMYQTGNYDNADKLVNICLCIIGAFGAVMMPRMSNLLAKNQKEECKDLFIRTMEIANFFGFAIAFGIAGVSKEFIPLFFGKGYDLCVLLTNLLCISAVFITWSCIVRTLYLIPAEKNTIFIHSTIWGAVINVTVNLILIPYLGAVGACIGTIMAEGFVAVYQSICVRNEMNMILCLKRSAPFLLIGLIMYGLIFMIPSLSSLLTTCLVKIAAGAIFYLAVSLIYFIKTRNQLVLDILGKIHLLK